MKISGSVPQNMGPPKYGRLKGKKTFFMNQLMQPGFPMEISLFWRREAVL